MDDILVFNDGFAKEILDCEVIDAKCYAVAEALHGVYELTCGRAFSAVHDAYRLSPEEVCRLRFLTSHLDGRHPLEFGRLARFYRDDPSAFSVDYMLVAPKKFVRYLRPLGVEQSKENVARTRAVARFLVAHDCHEPYRLLDVYGHDISRLYDAMRNCDGAGYDHGKAVGVLRELVASGVWPDALGFDKLDVVSNASSIKVALRTGIVRAAIPLVSTAVERFPCLNDVCAKAWRRVWECWCELSPHDAIASPCLLDYFIDDVVAQQFCQENLFTFRCIEHEHEFLWHSDKNGTCQVCYGMYHRWVDAHVVRKSLPCADRAHSHVAISNSAFTRTLPQGRSMELCPFTDICDRGRFKIIE